MGEGSLEGRRKRAVSGAHRSWGTTTLAIITFNVSAIESIVGVTLHTRQRILPPPIELTKRLKR